MGKENEKKMAEEEVMKQELDLDELEDVAGGSVPRLHLKCAAPSSQGETDKHNCVKVQERNIYGGGGFPNCAATVEDGSWCSDNDACYEHAVDYQGMNDCSKAWR